MLQPACIWFTRLAMMSGMMHSKITSTVTKNGVKIAGFLNSRILRASVFTIDHNSSSARAPPARNTAQHTFGKLPSAPGGPPLFSQVFGHARGRVQKLGALFIGKPSRDALFKQARALPHLLFHLHRLFCGHKPL